jgi:hypothetical protein
MVTMRMATYGIGRGIKTHGGNKGNNIRKKWRRKE